jgi:nitroreductase
MRQGIARTKAQLRNPGSSEWTATVMEQAPVAVFVFKPDGVHPWLGRSAELIFMEVVEIQSIGAAIKNMLLAAQDLGLASLWICDVFYAYEGPSSWLGEEGQMIAAVSFGYPDNNADARLRKPASEVVRWF